MCSNFQNFYQNSGHFEQNVQNFDQYFEDLGHNFRYFDQYVHDVDFQFGQNFEKILVKILERFWSKSSRSKSIKNS